MQRCGIGYAMHCGIIDDSKYLAVLAKEGNINWRWPPRTQHCHSCDDS